MERDLEGLLAIARESAIWAFTDGDLEDVELTKQLIVEVGHVDFGHGVFAAYNCDDTAILITIMRGSDDVTVRTVGV